MGSIITLISRFLVGAINAILTTTLQEWLFIQGKSFSFWEYYVLGDSDVLDIVVDPSAFAGDNFTVNPILYSSSSGPITIDYYAGTDADDDGTILQATNRRSGMPGPTIVLRENPTINDAGTRFAGEIIPATGLNPATSTGGGNQQGLPFEPSKTNKSLIRITNTDGAGVYFGIKITWFEA